MTGAGTGAGGVVAEPFSRRQPEPGHWAAGTFMLGAGNEAGANLLHQSRIYNLTHPYFLVLHSYMDALVAFTSDV